MSTYNGAIFVTRYKPYIKPRIKSSEEGFHNFSTAILQIVGTYGKIVFIIVFFFAVFFFSDASSAHGISNFSIRRSVHPSVCPYFTFLAFLSFLSSLLLPKCPSDLLQYCCCPPRYGRGFHRSRKMLGHDGEWFGLQGSLFYHLVSKRKKFPFKIFFKSTKCFISDAFF